jgi:hypothetical protein
VYRQLADVEDVQAELARLGATGHFRTRPRGADSAVPAEPFPSDPDASIASPSRRAERAGER